MCLLNSPLFRKDYKIAPPNDIYSTGCVSRLDAIAAAACVVTCESNVLFSFMYVWKKCAARQKLESQFVTLLSMDRAGRKAHTHAVLFHYVQYCERLV